MDGIIIFADDDVLEVNTYENALFQKFLGYKNNLCECNNHYSIIPITSILDLENVIDSMSICRVLILDWNFKRPTDNDIKYLSINDENPLNILKEKNVYSIIYIYSQEDISNDIKKELKNKFGQNRIFFSKKDKNKLEEEFTKICNSIKKFEEEHQYMQIPFVWSQAINRSVQNIFFELEQADINWIKEIKKKASNDVLEIIGIFHNILDESLIQNELLINELNKIITDESELDGEKAAKLYQRIFYSKLNDNAPIMTGDIFKFADNKYAILITPECEINNRKDMQLDFLSISSIKECIKSHPKLHALQDKSFQSCSKDNQTKAKDAYNNNELSIHLLPSFPFYEDVYNQTACINFKTAFLAKEKNDFSGKRTKYKLNSPYIQQLRQRYIAFFGRYGVPDIPNSLRIYNLENIK